MPDQTSIERQIDVLRWKEAVADGKTELGLHEFIQQPDRGDLPSVWMIRSRVGGSWWNTVSGWTLSIERATTFPANVSKLPTDGYWVEMVEVPL